MPSAARFETVVKRQDPQNFNDHLGVSSVGRYAGGQGRDRTVDLPIFRRLRSRLCAA